MEQLQGGEWHPLGFSSHTLTNAECRYSVFDKELLATYLAMLHCRLSIEGPQSMLFTDHWPLAQAVRHITDPWSPRQQCQVSMLSAFLSDVEYLPGARNIAVDALSRTPISVSFGFDFTDLSLCQQKCTKTQAYRIAIAGLQLHDVTLSLGGPTLLCDLSPGRPCLVVPLEARCLVFDLLHRLSHPGIRATQHLGATSLYGSKCVAP